MESIVLNSIKINNNSVLYVYEVSDGLSSFFSSTPFLIEYHLDDNPLDLNEVFKGILAIPFVCNILPIIWLTDSELIISELDESFYNSIPEFKKGYIDMYPELEFKGRIRVNKLTNDKPINNNKSATFFSGGLDAWCTLVRHLSERPDLILLWGADIPYTNEHGWLQLKSVVKETAEKFNLSLITVKTTYRKVINEGELDKAFSSKLHDGWWHGVQHGIALIGHSAPCNYTRGVGKQYIAASFSPEDKNVTCASYPTIDNYVRFFDCQVYHDAFITRSQKTEEIVSYRKRTGENINLHVCWQTTDGENCCRCEKCFRTMIGIMLEGDDPKNYGFKEEKTDYEYMRNFMTKEYDFSVSPFLLVFWKKYQSLLRERKLVLKNKPYYKDIKWLLKVDFTHPKMTRKSKKNTIKLLKRKIRKLIK